MATVPTLQGAVATAQTHVSSIKSLTAHSSGCAVVARCAHTVAMKILARQRSKDSKNVINYFEHSSIPPDQKPGKHTPASGSLLTCVYLLQYRYSPPEQVGRPRKGIHRSATHQIKERACEGAPRKS